MAAYYEQEKTQPYGEPHALPSPSDKEAGFGYEKSSDEDVTVTYTDAAFAEQVAAEQDHGIKFKTLGWKKAAALMFGEQVCLAIAGQAWSYSVLGWVGGILSTVVFTAFFWITSYTMWAYIMRHPEGCKDIVDIGYRLFGKSKIAREFTAFMLLANNILLIGFHSLTGAKIFNTLTDHSQCTIVFTVIATLMGIVCSIPRTLNHVSFMSIFSAACMAIALILLMVFAGVEDNPAIGYQGEWPTAGPVRTYAFPQKTTNWVATVNGMLNISFLIVPQILFPSFIAEMENPRDFPKALSALAIASLVLFTVPAVVGFAYLGQYTTAPAFGSLQTVYKKASFAFVIVPTILIGVIYSNVTAKYIYGRFFKQSRHQHEHTVVGWATWIGITTAIWGIGFIFAEVIPSMGDFLALLAAAFDSFFGFIFWSIAYYHVYRGKFFKGATRTVLTFVHVIALLVGLFLLGPGLYTSVTAIKESYASGTRPAFACADLSL